MSFAERKMQSGEREMRRGRLRVLIIGGYGVFGGRLAQLLADEPRLTLIIAGRSKVKAQTFCASLPFKAEVVPTALNRESDLDTQFATLAPDIVVDATGPWQNYKGDVYRVLRAALRAGVDYMDLADGSDFVRDVTQFDVEAKRRGVYALAGVSSFPVLTAAVVRRLAKDLSRIDHIAAGIAPSPYAGVGLNVIRAISSYAGQPVKLIRDERPATAYGLTETMRYTIAPPGRLPLNNLRFSLVDVPDLQALPPLWPGLKSIWMGAGPVPETLHRALNVLSRMVRWRLLPSLSPFGGLFYRVINNVRWGEHRGGMFVRIEGEAPDGARAIRSWHLLAEGDDGPLIPSMAIEAIVRRNLDGHRPRPGARAATSDLELEDYEKSFAKRTIYLGQRVDNPQAADCLYHRVLGNVWHGLPEPIQRMHDVKSTMQAEGSATVERGRSLLSHLVAALFGLPKAGHDVPVRVSFTPLGGAEEWVRNFDGREMKSVLSLGKGRSDRLLCERFGSLTFAFALVADAGRLTMVLRRWSIFGIAAPLWMAPWSHASESAENDTFNFKIEIGHWLTGLIVRYRGSLNSPKTRP